MSEEVNHSPIYDWVPRREAWSGRELRGVYCICGSDDYEEECVEVDTSIYDCTCPDDHLPINREVGQQ